jgi:hypothetical protein
MVLRKLGKRKIFKDETLCDIYTNRAIGNKLHSW